MLENCFHIHISFVCFSFSFRRNFCIPHINYKTTFLVPEGVPTMHVPTWRFLLDSLCSFINLIGSIPSKLIWDRLHTLNVSAAHFLLRLWDEKCSIVALDMDELIDNWEIIITISNGNFKPKFGGRFLSKFLIITNLIEICSFWINLGYNTVIYLNVSAAHSLLKFAQHVTTILRVRMKDMEWAQNNDEHLLLVCKSKFTSCLAQLKKLKICHSKRFANFSIVQNVCFGTWLLVLIWP